MSVTFDVLILRHCRWIRVPKALTECSLSVVTAANSAKKDDFFVVAAKLSQEIAEFPANDHCNCLTGGQIVSENPPMPVQHDVSL